MQSLFDDICAQLNALSNFHYTPSAPEQKVAVLNSDERVTLWGFLYFDGLKSVVDRCFIGFCGGVGLQLCLFAFCFLTLLGADNRGSHPLCRQSELSRRPRGGLLLYPSPSPHPPFVSSLSLFLDLPLPPSSPSYSLSSFFFLTILSLSLSLSGIREKEGTAKSGSGEDNRREEGGETATKAHSTEREEGEGGGYEAGGQAQPREGEPLCAEEGNGGIAPGEKRKEEREEKWERRKKN